ncbi:MAG: hypothetical protein EHM56_12830 [Chloroflexi bacterium]|nr:MAG: hypothetical protein EHM56_12830 [Chloroflexota bacterium]
MKHNGCTSVHEFVGDFIVYRNLEAVDGRLPRLRETWRTVGGGNGTIPRKSEEAYARVVAHLLRAARALEVPGVPLRRLIFVGDTRLNDGTAFANLCAVGGWPGAAFIGAENSEPPRVEVVEQGTTTLYLANRWAALAAFEGFCWERGLPIDEGTAVVLDLDKTTLGARGRNDRAIDRARVEAVWQTVAGLLGGEYDAAAFQVAYNLLNRPEFHPFTADNQDYLAYVCLVLGSGLMHLDLLVAQVRAGQMASFGQFITAVDGQAGRLPGGLREVHREILGRVRAGDPTPFKAFRTNEYRATVARLGFLPDDAPLERMLAEEILVTQEVREAALRWRSQGALIFALSDKPDEASFPPPDLAARGGQAIHRTETHAGGALAGMGEDSGIELRRGRRNGGMNSAGR